MVQQESNAYLLMFLRFECGKTPARLLPEDNRMIKRHIVAAAHRAPCREVPRQECRVHRLEFHVISFPRERKSFCLIRDNKKRFLGSSEGGRQ